MQLGLASVCFQAQAVQNLLQDVPPEALLIIDKHIKELGWESSAWTDESLSSRHWMPGFQC